MLSPFRGFYDARGEVDRLFDDMMGGLGRRRGPREGLRYSGWAPAVDVLTKDADLVIRAELPGVKQEDVDITLQNGLLTISGEHKVDGEEGRGGYFIGGAVTARSVAAWRCRRGSTTARSTPCSRTVCSRSSSRGPPWKKPRSASR